MKKDVKKAGPRSPGSALKFEPVKDAKVVPGKAQRALKAGPHGSQTDSQGNNNAAPKKHKPTDGGNPGVGGKL